MSKSYTIEDIQSHNKKQDLWIAIGNQVYNITDFLADHPGGEEILLDVGGKDASKDFEDVGHSTDAQALMKKYIVGNLKNSRSEKPPPKPQVETTTPDPKPKAPKEESSSSKVILVPLLILLVAALAYVTLGTH